MSRRESESGRGATRSEGILSAAGSTYVSKKLEQSSSVRQHENFSRPRPRQAASKLLRGPFSVICSLATCVSKKDREEAVRVLIYVSRLSLNNARATHLPSPEEQQAAGVRAPFPFQPQGDNELPSQISVHSDPRGLTCRATSAKAAGSKEMVRQKRCGRDHQKKCFGRSFAFLPDRRSR